MDAAAHRSRTPRHVDGFVARPAERAEQAAARAVAHLELYFREDRRQGDRRQLENARKALDEALELAS